MARQLIIDGHNLAHALRPTRALLGSDQQRAREALVELLRGYKKAAPAEITVVFDGAGQQDGRGRRVAGITVMFSRPPQSADDRIRELVNGARDPGGLLVVSSDRAVWRHARNKGAQAVTSQEFGERLFAALRARADAAEKPVAVDVAAWQRIFSQRRPDDE
ncbi:MAG TPA: NYN domain-containing protein [Candidatus Edwardsbacteria bacterium]|nr:NYN domain-containing protein [Candidatus Edwardsbacteria bacterium]